MRTLPILDLFMMKGALLTRDHFVYKSGKHGSVYFAKKLLLEDPEILNPILANFVEIISNRDRLPMTVVGPESGGAILARGVSEAFRNMGVTMPAVGVRKREDGFMLTTDDILLTAGLGVVLVEDVLNSGTTLKQVLFLLERIGARVELIIAIVNRGTTTSTDYNYIPLITLADAPQLQHEPDECPLCRDGVPINTQFGHGAEYLAKKSWKQGPALP